MTLRHPNRAENNRTCKFGPNCLWSDFSLHSSSSIFHALYSHHSISFLCIVCHFQHHGVSLPLLPLTASIDVNAKNLLQSLLISFWEFQPILLFSYLILSVDLQDFTSLLLPSICFPHTAIMKLVVSLLLVAFALAVATVTADPDLLQDICVADLTSGISFNYTSYLLFPLIYPFTVVKDWNFRAFRRVS